MLEINPGLIAWTLLVFVVLLVLLKSVAWKPIIEALRKREESIHEALDTAAKAQREAEKLLAEHRAQLAKMNDEAARILQEAKHNAEKMKSEIINQAHATTHQMIDRAKEEISRDKDAAIQSLRKEVASLAILAAGKILDESLDEQKHRHIVDSFLENLPKN
ncbi:MAG: F0F1 ATP synthase subunit B [Bacteroidota bacterium]